MRARALTAAVVVAIAIPAAAIAKPGNGGGHGGTHPVSYVFKGTYAGDGSVNVLHGNRHVRHAELVGTTVQFDLTNTKLTVADTNADGAVDATDIVADDKVVVKAKLPKADPGAQPFAARHLVDQTNPGDDAE